MSKNPRPVGRRLDRFLPRGETPESPETVHQENFCRAVIGKVKKRIKDQKLKNFGIICEEGDAAEKILEIAKSKGVDTIVLGSRGLGGVRSLLMGSVSSKVCHAAPCTCIIVK